LALVEGSVSDDRPSIAELQRVWREMLALEAQELGSGLLSPRILNAAPVLLEIAAAALAYRKAKKTAAKARYILYQSAFSDSMSAESEAQDKEEIRCRNAYDAALNKVRE
jgi:hypothetical protein